MFASLRVAPAALSPVLALLAVTGCSGEAPPADNGTAALAQVEPGVIPLDADNIARLGLRFESATQAVLAPIASVPALIVPPPNARVAVAATFPGVMTRIQVVEGQAVKRGQPLATVSSRDILSMGADLSRANARLGVAQSSASRLSQLEREGVIAGARADEARATLNEARADVSEKSRILGMVNGSGASGSYTLTAPIAGKVTSANIHAGSVLDGTTAPYVIDAAGQFEAQAQLPERLAGQVKPGMTVSLEGAGDAAVRGTVTSVGSTIEPTTRSVTLKAKLPASPGALAGRATSLSLFGPAPAGAVTVAQGAVVTLPEGEAVFVRTAKGVAVRRVKAGGKDGERILILSGIRPGEQVVVTGTSALKPLAAGE